MGSRAQAQELWSTSLVAPRCTYYLLKNVLNVVVDTVDVKSRFPFILFCVHLPWFGCWWYSFQWPIPESLLWKIGCSCWSCFAFRRARSTWELKFQPWLHTPHPYPVGRTDQTEMAAQLPCLRPRQLRGCTSTPEFPLGSSRCYAHLRILSEITSLFALFPFLDLLPMLP